MTLLRRSAGAAMSALILLCTLACAKTPYVVHPQIEQPDTLQLRPSEVQIERGRPHRLLDGLGHYLFSLPAKLVLFNWDVENHDISPETEAILREYLAHNNLHAVKIRLNQYAPGGEWSRLVRNRSISGVWRYTFGVLSVTFYTIFPGRVFGGDHYNPYTNTISLYSDHPAIALHEAGHAKDFALREWKGLYSALGLLPLVSLWHEAQATGDAVGYLREREYCSLESDSYKILYPAYFTYIGGELVNVLDWFNAGSQLVYLAAVIPGHVAGRIKSATVDVERQECAAPLPAAPEIFQAERHGP